jgi:predicted patatin/cPLA2 family phospholipase
MIFEGEHSVIKAIREKKRLMEEGLPHEHIRPLMVQGGGLMRGAYGAGAALALEELGFTNSFTSLVGVSSGAPTIAHFAAGTTAQGINILLEECSNPKFVNPWRFWNQVDTKFFLNTIRYDERKRIEVDKVLANPAEIYFGVAEYKTALPKLLKPENEDHFFKCMHASINMQNVSPYKIIIDGIHYADGGFSRPHVISEAAKTLNPTHMLIITNNDRDFTPISRTEKLLNQTIFRLRLNGVLAQAINTRRESRDAAIESAISGGIKTAVVWGDGSISGVEQNAKKIASAVEASRTWWHGLFALEK